MMIYLMPNTRLLMTTEKANKIPLDLSRYEEFGINQGYMAFIVNFENVDEDQCDNIEADYLSKGYKVFHTEMARSKDNLFKYTVIIAKMGFTF